MSTNGAPRWRVWSFLTDDVLRAIVLVAVCLASALIIIDYTTVPTEALEEGDVASRTVVAPFTYPYPDFAKRELLQSEAREGSLWEFVYDAALAETLKGRIEAAYAAARKEIALETMAQELGDPSELSEIPEEITGGFRENLGVYMPNEVIAPLALAGFPVEAERLSVDLLGHAMKGLVIADKDALPPEPLAFLVIKQQLESREEIAVTNHDLVTTPETARERLSIALMEANVGPEPWVDAAVTVARACMRPNLVYDEQATQDRRDRAVAGVPLETVVVKQGTTLFRQGDPLTADDLERYRYLQTKHVDRSFGYKILAVSLFLLLLFASLYHFGASYLQGFTTRVRDVATVGLLLVMTAAAARLVVALSPSLAALVGSGAEADLVWFVVPIAGAAMLVRLLVGVAWTVVYALSAAAVAGLVMDLQALYVVFFLLSSIAAAGAVEHTRERMAVLRAGLFTGVINAAAVLLIHFLQLFVVGDEFSMGATMRPVWAMIFAFVGGVVSSWVVLGLMPLFEAVGFVTDYRMLELANLNHPLLRQLMLRSPGSYHHSIIVGSLAEAACEAVGANALQARVGAYFHDIGKTAKPQYFVENQRGGGNRHDRMSAEASAAVIINHVIDGARMAREHNLPKPILDNIYMHHGTGILQYFVAQAKEEADDPSDVDESKFRYPGPKPNTRESGIIMLADKVEAATRTIRNPNEKNIRAMITKIINSVMADGQFENCPITFQELYTIGDTFVGVMLGIYHQRIEYPQTREISQGRAARAARADDTPTPIGSIITLEIPSETDEQPKKVVVLDTGDVRAAGDGDSEADEHTDYESLKNLPGH